MSRSQEEREKASARTLLSSLLAALAPAGPSLFSFPLLSFNLVRDVRSLVSDSSPSSSSSSSSVCPVCRGEQALEAERARYLRGRSSEESLKASAALAQARLSSPAAPPLWRRRPLAPPPST